MGEGAEDAMAFEMGLQAHHQARHALYGMDEDLLGKVRICLGRGLHTQGDGSQIRIQTMTDSHLNNSIARGERVDSDFWKLTLPYLRAERSRRGE